MAWGDLDLYSNSYMYREVYTCMYMCVMSIITPPAL